MTASSSLVLAVTVLKPAAVPRQWLRRAGGILRLVRLELRLGLGGRAPAAAAGVTVSSLAA